ncbi:MAG: hypothetical protein ACOX76_00320 [Lachnospiraceae bacterium]|jgi:hypothetical protein
MSTNPTLYEAESAVNTQYETRIFEKAECSNGMCVGWIGCGRYLQFNHIYVDKTGVFSVKIYYMSDETRYVKMKTSYNPDETLLNIFIVFERGDNYEKEYFAGC